jgi:hypothetical protein
VTYLRRLLVPLLILAMLSAIPGIPLSEDLRGYPLVIHLAVGTVFAGVLAVFLIQPPQGMRRLATLSWLLISLGLVALVVPMLGWVSAESGHLWLETHGWLSIGGLGLLGLSASIQRRAAADQS